MYPKRIGQVYMLVCFNKWNIYFGSTTLSLEERLRLHVKDYKMYLKGTYHYVTSFEVIKEDNCQIISVEDVYDDEGVTLEERERYYIEKYKDNCVNKYIPGRTNAEYYRDNREKLLGRTKERYQNNKAKIKQKANKKFNCECGGKYTSSHKAKHFKSIKHQDYIASLP